MTIKLQLHRLPSDVENERRFAARTDGVTNMPRTVTALGFSASAAEGDVLDVDLAALGLTMASVSGYVRPVVGLTLSQPMSARAGVFDLVELHADAGATVYLPPAQAAHAERLGLGTIV